MDRKLNKANNTTDFGQLGQVLHGACEGFLYDLNKEAMTLRTENTKEFADFARIRSSQLDADIVCAIDRYETVECEKRMAAVAENIIAEKSYSEVNTYRPTGW